MLPNLPNLKLVEKPNWKKNHGLCRVQIGPPILASWIIRNGISMNNLSWKLHYGLSTERKSAVSTLWNIHGFLVLLSRTNSWFSCSVGQFAFLPFLYSHSKPTSTNYMFLDRWITNIPVHSCILLWIHMVYAFGFVIRRNARFMNMKNEISWKAKDRR